MVFNGLAAAGYWLFSGIGNLGDWAAILDGHQPAWLWHVGMSVLGGAVVGNIGSWDQDGKRLLGYWIGQAHWGRGIATAALTEFIAQCDRRRPICAHVASHNTASIRVLEKCGFLRVGEEVGDDGVTEVLMERAVP